MGNLFQPSASAEDIYVKHLFLPWGDAQLPVNIRIMFFRRVYADNGTFGDLTDLTAFNIVLQNRALHRCQCLYPGDKIGKECFQIRRFSCLLSSGLWLDQSRQFINFRKPGTLFLLRSMNNYPICKRLWKALLLSFGNKIKVIWPEEYKKELIETAKKFWYNYDI